MTDFIRELNQLFDDREAAAQDVVPRRVVGRNPDGTSTVQRLDGECPERWAPGGERTNQVTLFPADSPFDSRGTTAVVASTSRLGLVWLESQEPRDLIAGKTQTVTVTGRGLTSDLTITYLFDDLSAHPQITVDSIEVLDSGTAELVVTVEAGAPTLTAAPIGFSLGERTLYRQQFYGVAPASATLLYRAVERVDDTHLKVGTYDEELRFVELLHPSVTAPQGELGFQQTLSGLICLIAGDADLPDGSLAFFAKEEPGAGFPLHDGGPWYLHTLDIESGELRAATIPLREGYQSMRVVRGFDFYRGKLRFLVWQSLRTGGPIENDHDVIEVWEADSRLEALRLVQAVPFGIEGHIPLCWGRSGDHAQLIRWTSPTVQGIDSIDLLGPQYTLGPGRQLPAGAAINPEAIGLHTDVGDTYFVVFDAVFPRFYITLVRVGDGGHATHEGWPERWLQYAEWDTGQRIVTHISFARRALTGDGLHLAHVYSPGAFSYGLLRTETDLFDTSGAAPTVDAELGPQMTPHYLLPL